MTDVYAANDATENEAVSHDEIQIHADAHAARSVEVPSAESLSECQHSGWLSKRGLKFGCLPSWKRRFFILKGQYIFKFESPTVSRRAGRARAWTENAMRNAHKSLALALLLFFCCLGESSEGCSHPRARRSVHGGSDRSEGERTCAHDDHQHIEEGIHCWSSLGRGTHGVDRQDFTCQSHLDQATAWACTH